MPILIAPTQNQMSETRSEALKVQLQDFLDNVANLLNAPTFDSLISEAIGAGAGSRVLTGARVGDKVVMIFGTAAGREQSQSFGTAAPNAFEATISVVDRIQQLDAPTAPTANGDLVRVTLYRRPDVTN